MLDEALEQYRAALRVKPSFPDAHLNLGNAYAQKDMLDKAIAQYEMALELDPDNQIAVRNLELIQLNNAAGEGDG